LNLQVGDVKTIIPRNSLIEVNQSGLLMDTKIDITPRDPIPTPSVGPLDQDCTKEGLIVCDREKINGQQGTSLDTLVRICTRLGRALEEIGISNTYSLVERVLSIIEEAKPLLTQVWCSWNWWVYDDDEWNFGFFHLQKHKIIVVNKHLFVTFIYHMQ